MTVWVVQDLGRSVWGVFSSERKAQVYIASQKNHEFAPTRTQAQDLTACEYTLDEER